MPSHPSRRLRERGVIEIEFRLPRRARAWISLLARSCADATATAPHSSPTAPAAISSYCHSGFRFIGHPPLLPAVTRVGIATST